jgi:hypothetical protein
MIIYTLYIKTHKITGLKYLGQTTANDPHRYKGSGVDWVDHINRYGYDVRTEIIYQGFDKEERNQLGRYYSRIWNIVKSQDDFGNKIWANRIPETGGGPGIKPGSRNHSGSNNPMHGKSHSDEVRLASKLRRSKTNSERRWFNDGSQCKFLKECPSGWKFGRINQKPTTAGNKWYNNGIIAVISKSPPSGDNWIRGMLPKKMLYTQSIVVVNV